MNSVTLSGGIVVSDSDLISVDGNSGVIEKVILPGSADSRDYSCEDSGGLLINFDDGVLALIPLDHSHEYRKLL